MKLAVIDNNGDVYIIVEDLEEFDLDRAFGRSEIIDSVKSEVKYINKQQEMKNAKRTYKEL